MKFAMCIHIKFLILTADRHRPYLMTKVAGTNDYINAVFLDVSQFSLFLIGFGSANFFE